MQTKSLIMTVTMITVVVILSATVLIPVLDDAEDSFYESVEYSNVSGDYQTHLAPITSETSNTLNISSTEIVTNNGTIEYWTDDTTYGNVMLITDTIYVMVTGGAAISIITSSGTVSATTFSAVASAGELTYSIDSADSVTTTYAAGYIADPTGDYISCPASNTKYFDSENFAQCRYDSAYRVYIDGVGYTDGTVTTSMTVNSTEVDGTDGQVSTLDSIKYTSSKGLSSLCVMENAATYTYTDSPGVVSILGAIAPVVIAALVIAVVGVIFARRD